MGEHRNTADHTEHQRVSSDLEVPSRSSKRVFHPLRPPEPFHLSIVECLLLAGTLAMLAVIYSLIPGPPA